MPHTLSFLSRLLVVDDDESIRDVIALTMETVGSRVEVVQVVDGASAVQEATTRPCDAILLDVDLGAERGEDVVVLLRAAQVTAPIVLLTGTTDPGRVAAGMRAGAIDYLSKSKLDPDRLASVLRAARRVADAEARASSVRAEEDRHRSQLAALAGATLLLSRASNPADVAEATRAAIASIFEAEGRVVLTRNEVELAACPEAPLLGEVEGLTLVAAGDADALGGTLQINRPGRSLDGSEQLVAEHLHRAAISNAERLHLLDEAREAARERQEIVAIVSHDLRTPLQTIAMGLDAIELSLDATARQKTAANVGRVKRAITTMTQLLRDLLDVSRIHDTMLSVRVAPQRVKTLVDDLHHQFVPLAEKQGLTLVADVQPADLVVELDSARVTQALGNIVTNALRHTTRGSVAIRVRATGDRARFEIEDTGRGIPPGVRARLFERLFQGEADRSGALGLGLYIVKGIVDAHGGKVGVLSEVDRGSTFWIELPLRSPRTTA